MVAFALDAAWEEGGEREREAAYLEALAAELLQNEETFSGYLDFLGIEELETHHAFGSVVFSDNPVPADTIHAMIWDLGPIWFTYPERAALSDILSSGGIAFIQDAQIRLLVARYSRRIDQHIGSQEALDDLWDDSLVGYLSNHGSLVDMLPEEEGPVRRRGAFAVDVDAFVENRDFANLLTRRLILLDRIQLATQNLLNTMEQLRESLPPAV